MARQKPLSIGTVGRRRVRRLMLFAVVEFVLLVLLAAGLPFVVSRWNGLVKSSQQIGELNSNLAAKIETLLSYVRETTSEIKLIQPWRHSDGISFNLPLQWVAQGEGDSKIVFFDQNIESEMGGCFLSFHDNPQQLTIKEWLSLEIAEEQLTDQKIEEINGFRGLSVNRPGTPIGEFGTYAYYLRKGKQIFQYSYVYPIMRAQDSGRNTTRYLYYSDMCQKILTTLQIE